MFSDRYRLKWFWVVFGGTVRAMEIEATYTVPTPMFLGGAEPQNPEMRLASFKGMLRYWWRALAWSRFGGNLTTILREEEDLFGSARGGQSRVLMRLKESVSPPKVVANQQLRESASSKDEIGHGARYLGYGVLNAYASSEKKTKDAQLTRGCFRGPFDFTVQLRTRTGELPEAGNDALLDALKAVGTLGGLGAKNRKGYGSLVLKSLVDGRGTSHWQPPGTMLALADAIQSFTAAARTCELWPKYTAICNQSRVLLLTAERDTEPLKLLDLIGRELVRYRSKGKNGMILGQRYHSERNFEDDDKMIKLRTGPGHPRRIAFGLPHNYGKGDHQEVGPAGNGLDRRASPLFLHIHDCGSMPVGVLSFFPARFLPGKQPKIKVGKRIADQVPESELFKPITSFLDRLCSETERQEPFTQVLELPK